MTLRSLRFFNFPHPPSTLFFQISEENIHLICRLVNIRRPYRNIHHALYHNQELFEYY